MKKEAERVSDIILLTPEQTKTIKRFGEFYRSENGYEVLTQAHVYRAIYYVLFRKYKIPFAGEVAIPKSAYEALDSVANGNIDYTVDTKSGSKQLVVRTDKEFKDSTEKLRRVLQTKYNCRIIKQFLNALEKYLDSVGA